MKRSGFVLQQLAPTLCHGIKHENDPADKKKMLIGNTGCKRPHGSLPLILSRDKLRQKPSVCPNARASEAEPGWSPLMGLENLKIVLF